MNHIFVNVDIYIQLCSKTYLVYRIYFAEDTWVEKKQSRAENLCCLLLANEFIMPHSYGIKKKTGKKCITNKQDLWRLQHVMRFIKEEHKLENQTMVVPEPGPSKGKEKIKGRERGRGRGRGKSIK